MKGSTREDQRPAAAELLLAMMHEGRRQLDGELAVIDGLNVFPVPDGDTGSNMLATLDEALAQAERGETLQEVAGQLAQGALLGARGNSGVILSQLLRGVTEAISERGTVDCEALRDGLHRAAKLAYAAVAEPVEGTMLSVLAEVSHRAARPPADETLASCLHGILGTAEEAVAKTPEQLAILREAQVVDSGGYGLLIMLRGWYEAAVGQPAGPIAHHLLGVERVRQQALKGEAHPALLSRSSAGRYGYCVTLFVATSAADEGVVRRRLGELGDSVLVVSSGGRMKLHVHAPKSEAVSAYAASIGTLVRSDISNIDDQAQVGEAAPALPIVAVAPGQGLAKVFGGLGVFVVAGGAGQNPSTAELLKATDEVAASAPGTTVFLLPNNSNILAAAKQVAQLRSDMQVIDSRTIPQGVAAALAYDAMASDAENEVRMTEVLDGVLSAELVAAVRPATIGGLSVQAGDVMVLVEGELVGTGDSGLAALVERARRLPAELATIYYGVASSEDSAQQLGDRLRAELPQLQVETVIGDQRQSLFILSFE